MKNKATTKPLANPAELKRMLDYAEAQLGTLKGIPMSAVTALVKSQKRTNVAVAGTTHQYALETLGAYYCNVFQSAHPIKLHRYGEERDYLESDDAVRVVSSAPSNQGSIPINVWAVPCDPDFRFLPLQETAMAYVFLPFLTSEHLITSLRSDSKFIWYSGSRAVGTGDFSTAYLNEAIVINDGIIVPISVMLHRQLCRPATLTRLGSATTREISKNYKKSLTYRTLKAARRRNALLSQATDARYLPSIAFCVPSQEVIDEIFRLEDQS